MEKFSNAVLLWTEKRLTLKKAKKEYHKKHKTFVSELLEWLDAIVFAVVVVFFINQWIFQLFVIPSPSMEKTLLTGDRVLVSKLTYGIEIYPEGPKVFDSHEPDRGDIITFYNPESESRGTLFNIFSQLIFRATFTLVNIDKNPDGSMREALLVKRAVGMPGDTVTFRNGDAYIKYSGTDQYVKDGTSGIQRLIQENTYDGYNAQGMLNGLYDSGLSSNNLPRHLLNDNANIDSNAYFTDMYGYRESYYKGCRMADPSDMESRSEQVKYSTGIYVPEGCILPLGDNRDNSGDGRYFGPVNTDAVNGFVATRIWPVSRVGSPY